MKEVNKEIEIYYSVLLDEKHYYKNGELGGVSKPPEGMISVDSFPSHPDTRLWPAYKYENNEWIFDEKKAITIQEKISKQEAIEKKYFEIEELKKKLSDADYNAIKCLEQIIKYLAPILHFDWYKDIGDNREAWREQINKLEEEIKKIEEGGSN